MSDNSPFTVSLGAADRLISWKNGILMEAEDMLNATHELEESGMTRSQSEAVAKTIIAAVEPLDVRADLEATKSDVK